MGRRSSRRSAGQGRSPLGMLENLRNQRGVIDADDYPEFSAALRAGFDVNGEDALEALHPAHRGGWFVAVDDTA